MIHPLSLGPRTSLTFPRFFCWTVVSVAWTKKTSALTQKPLNSPHPVVSWYQKSMEVPWSQHRVTSAECIQTSATWIPSTLFCKILTGICTASNLSLVSGLTNNSCIVRLQEERGSPLVGRMRLKQCSDILGFCARAGWHMVAFYNKY